MEEGQLDGAVVGLARADHALVRPDGDPWTGGLAPLPLVDHLGIGLLDQGAKPGQGLAPRVAQLLDLRCDQLRWCFVLRWCSWACRGGYRAVLGSAAGRARRADRVWHALRRGPDRAAAGNRRLRALGRRQDAAGGRSRGPGDDPRGADGRAGVHGRRRGRPSAGDERAGRGRARRRARDRVQRRVARGLRRAVRRRGAPARAGGDRHRRVLPRRARPARASGCRSSPAARRRARARPCRAPRPGPRSSAAASRCARATSCSATTTAC